MCLLFLEGQNSVLSVHCPAQFILHLTNYFGFCYKLPNFLAIIDEYNGLSSNWALR